MFGKVTPSTLPVTDLEHSKPLAFVEQGVPPPSQFTTSTFGSLSTAYGCRCLVWLRPSLFWDVTRRTLVAGYRVSGQPIGPIFKGQYTPRNIPEQQRPQLRRGGSPKSSLVSFQ
jgi:hypothetical protein